MGEVGKGTYREIKCIHIVGTIESRDLRLRPYTNHADRADRLEEPLVGPVRA